MEKEMATVRGNSRTIACITMERGIPDVRQEGSLASTCSSCPSAR